MEIDDILRRFAIQAPGLLFAIVAHEWAHARVALVFGDDTAQREGRLTLDPMAHIDLVGTIIWPLICLILPGGMLFGYAKPVPINPTRFKKIRKGIFWVSFAGPGMNILIGVFSAFALVVAVLKPEYLFGFDSVLQDILKSSLTINFILAAFNLIPFPPLDGSRMVSSMLSYNRAMAYESLQQYGLIFLLVLWFTNIFHYLVFSPALWAATFLVGVFNGILSPLMS